MPFTLHLDRKHNVLLVRFGRSLTREATGAMRAAVGQYVARHGACPAIADFGAIEEVKVDSDFIRTLAQTPAVLRGHKRVLVAPTDILFGTLRMFEQHQAVAGDQPLVVRTLAQAYELLGIVEPDFQQVALE